MSLTNIKPAPPLVLVSLTEKELEELKRDRERLDWLERFLQLSESAVFTCPTGQPHEERHDDTDTTRWNHPFSIGFSAELEHRGDYRWEELSNGSRGIRPAIDAARMRYDEICSK